MTTLIISVCNNKLLELEFVRPVANLVTDKKIIHFKNLKKKDITNSKRIIICGTALKDNECIDCIDKFNWITSYTKPLLGICAGAQIICKQFQSSLEPNLEIKVCKPKLVSKDPILENVNLNEIYCLHSFSCAIPKNFTTILKTSIPHLIKKQNTYACLFHPEVKNKQLIRNFITLY